MKVFDEAMVLWSNDICIIEGRDWGRMPLLVDQYCTVIDPPTVWLTHLRTHDGRSTKTIKQYSYSLRVFWNFLIANSLNWKLISDKYLRLWRNSLMHSGEIATANGHLSVVINFYLWAQEHSLVSDLIGKTQPDRSPYPIRLIAKGRRQRLTSPLLLRETRKALAPFPTEAEVDAMYEKLSSGASRAEAIRNCLMADWIISTGMRRAEVLSLNIDQIPSLLDCYKYEESDQLYRLKIVGKRNVQRVVSITADLLVKTRLFINQTRSEIFPRRVINHADRKAIFISSRNGDVLSETSVSRLFSLAMKTEGKKLTMHRLRARFASKLVQSFLFAELQNSAIYEVIVSTALHKAAEVLGHKSIDTLYPYLYLALDLVDSELAEHLRNAAGGILKTPNRLKN